MVGFLRIPEWFGDELAEGEQFLVGGGDETAMLMREASTQVSSYSPRLDGDFRRFQVFDTPEVNEFVKILLGDTGLEFDLPVLYVGAGIVAPNATRMLVDAYDFNRMPDAGTMWYVGARNYSRTEREWARHSQRLLPGFEVDLNTAMRTALDELNGNAFRLMINLDILDPSWASAVRRPVSFGVSPNELWQALQAIRGANIELLQVCGLDPRHSYPQDTARLGVELVRDVALLAWGA